MKKRFLRCLFAGVVAAAVSLGAATAAVSDASAAWFPDDKLVTVSESAYGKSGLKSEPVCVADVANKEILESVASGKNAAVAILTLDDDMSVVGADGEVICSLAAAMDDYLKKEIKGKIIDVTEKNNHDYEVIAEYYPQEYYLETKLYTQKFIVSTRNSGGDSENSAGGGNAGGGNAGGCGAVLLFWAGSGGSAVFFAVIGLFAAALALSKLIKGKENG